MFRRFVVSRKAVTKVQATIIAAVIIVAVVVGVAAWWVTRPLPPPPPPVPEAIRIGIVAPMTGVAADVGRDMWSCSVLASEEINEAGGVYVKEYDTKLPVRLFLGDTETSKEGGIRAVTKLITEDKVHILVGGFSSGITVADQVVASEHGMPWIITGASTPYVTHRTDIDVSMMFHHMATTDYYGRITANWLVDDLLPRLTEALGLPKDYKLRVSVIYQDTFYGVGAHEGFVAEVTEKGLPIDIVHEDKFPMGTTDFAPMLPAVAAVKPDAIYHAGFPKETASFIVQARRDFGINSLVATVECNNDVAFYEIIGKWGEGSVVMSTWSTYSIPRGATYDKIVAFKDRFYERWKTYPGMMGVRNYEGVLVAAKVIEMAGTLDPKAIVKALDELHIPEICEPREGGVIDYTEDFRELRPLEFADQTYFDPETGEARSRIVYPAELANPPGTELWLPDWYLEYLGG
jgi:branched-chain amino acid transport system substrate-binding protein